MKKLVLTAGLPRSGSTLLQNILGQNPRFYSTPTSGLVDVLVQTRNMWTQNEIIKAWDREKRETMLADVMKSIVDGYFTHAGTDVCFDKSRGWCEYLEIAGVVCGGRDNVRCIVTVRDVRDVCASFEKLYRKTTVSRQVAQEMGDASLRMKTAAGRVSVWLDNHQPVGRSILAVRDAVTRGWRAQMLFVEFDDLTNKPKDTLERIYQFIGEDRFAHDFKNVEMVTSENDDVHGFKDLHVIRKEVLPIPEQWSRVYDKSVFDDPVWKGVENLAKFWRQLV